ncbi:hypothetical protein AB205_0199110 [Aquarana catesbeiana]|uniref:Uncharacterized protein n=1 Tax=Aquarana catesbeiana TaxID=8400 RepID=A0A2G9RLZ5_AQUCT|nr:hypothetical protein AB205_0199110 [Aquarana catesbeiana]
MCETCPKKVSIPAWLRGLIMSSTWNSAQTDNCTLLPSNVHIHISVHKYVCVKYTFCFILIGEKRLAPPSEDTSNTTPHEEGEQSIVVPQDVEEVEVEEVLEFGTTTGDVQVVVPKSSHFNSDSAQRLIQEIMFCSRDLDLIKKKTKEIEQRLKNMIDVLGRVLILKRFQDFFFQKNLKF